MNIIINCLQYLNQKCSSFVNKMAAKRFSIARELLNSMRGLISKIAPILVQNVIKILLNSLAYKSTQESTTS